ncbi:hypothetical protein [Arthrobacter sp. CJ23]|uniref:hypothetical protein n=1 Tax=Arthrobacter sp. CJ23 TaxID=2972479 RepID=UPI00215C6E06|nr:hypothetical protein [Arthrobacter sp. CJ23]UVJ38034.1 hypothetical protein NVV90_12260 [Arthrobacter sp. CJ23]
MSIEHPELHKTNVSPADLPDHVERVDEAFDNTSLPQAHAEGLVDNQVPDHAQDVIEMASPETANFIERHQAPARKRRGLLIGASATVAAGLIAAGAVFGVKAAIDQPKNSRPQPGPDTASSASVLPGPVETAKAPETKEPTVPSPENGFPVPTAEQIKIPATLTPEEVGRAFEQRLTAWVMAGATKENGEKWLNTPDKNAYITEIATQNAKLFTDNMYVNGWESNQRLKNAARSSIDISVQHVRAWFKTSGHVWPEDKEPYHSWEETGDIRVVSSSPDGGVLEITSTSRNNAEKNRASTVEIGINDGVNKTITYRLTYVKEGETFKISNLGK